MAFLHAFPMNSAMWLPVSDLLGDSACSLTVDFRGYGDTPLEPDAAFSMADLAGDLLETLDSVGVHNSVLVGCSMGGYVAFEAWRRAPERVAGLVLCNTRADADTDAVRERRHLLVAKTTSEGLGWLMPFVESNLVSSNTREIHPGVLSRVLEIASNAPSRSVIRTMEALAARSDSTPLLPGINVPTLVIAGDGDIVTPSSDMKCMAAAIPNARFELIPDAGHLSPLETPAEFAAHLAVFLAAF